MNEYKKKKLKQKNSTQNCIIYNQEYMTCMFVLLSHKQNSLVLLLLLLLC